MFMVVEFCFQRIKIADLLTHLWERPMKKLVHNMTQLIRSVLGLALGLMLAIPVSAETVSYTHLTLPTILLV